jgi:FkbM family methyltransferase
VPTAGLEARLSNLLSESASSVHAREEQTLERTVGSLDSDFILFGAGNLGRKVLGVLKKRGKTPAAFIDNNRSIWGTVIDGVPVMGPAEAATEFDPKSVGIITTIWSGEATDRMCDRIGPLEELGFSKIALFGHLAWKYPAGLLPHFSLDRPSKVLDHAADIMTAFRLLADDESRNIFVNNVEWRLFLDYDALPPPTKEEIYFNRRYINRLDTEVLYDVGAFTGDSTRSFLTTERGKKFSEIHMFEPSWNNYRILQEYVGSLGCAHGKIFPHCIALGDTIGEIQVESDRGPSSRVGKGNQTVPITTIDEISKSISGPTFIKIDVEGFEPQCFTGARQIIARTAPAIAASVYHIQSHLWDIILQLHQYQEEYTFRLCPHCPDGWDLVLYAVAPNRVPA